MDPIHERIRQCLLQIGLESVPGPGVPLADHGFDSLMLVLAVAALEEEFRVKIPVENVEAEFTTVDGIASFLGSLGVK